MTAGPTQAMAAAAGGEGFAIAYGGRAQYDYAPAVGRAFVAAGSATAGAVVATFPACEPQWRRSSMRSKPPPRRPPGRITWDETPLPFPPELEAHALADAIGPVQQPSLADGVAETVARFRQHDASSP